MDKIVTIGSVVELTNKEKYMIIGYYGEDARDNKLYDYIGCKYPAGLFGGIQLFNEPEIKNIEFNGFEHPVIDKMLNEIREEVK